MVNRLLHCNTCDIYATPVVNLQQPLYIHYNYTRERAMHETHGCYANLYGDNLTRTP